VNGFLLVAAGRPEFCESLTTTAPPGCAGDRFTVQGLDIGLLDGLQVDGNVQWSGERMQLLGSVEDATLVISPPQQQG